MERAHLLTNTQNYLGNYIEDRSYKKFDIVFHPESHKFYYAKDDIAHSPSYSLSKNNRFYFSTDGPVWGGFKTFYIYDYDNDVSFLQGGQKIVVSGSQNSNGEFLIIDVKENYSDKDIVPGDFVLSEVLDATENTLNNFTSEWFLAGVNNFVWNGRDWTNYVKRSGDLLLAYENAVNEGYNLGIEAWGKEHYLEYGEAENRSLPVNQGGEDIWIDWMKNYLRTNIAGFNQANSSGNLDPNEKSLYFQIHGLDYQTFFTKKKYKIENENRAYVYIEDRTPKRKEHVFQLHNLNVDFDYSQKIKESIDKIKFSDNGLRCIMKKGTSLESYSRNTQSSSWQLEDSINVGSNFLLSAISDDCSHIAYCTWPGVVRDLELENGGTGWLNGYSTGIIDLNISPPQGYGLLFLAIAILASKLKVKLVGTVSQSGIAGSEGTFDATVSNGVITSISWINKPTFLSNDQGLEFSFKAYGQWLNTAGIPINPVNLQKDSTWYELKDLYNYNEAIKPIISTENSIGSGFQASTNNPKYFSNSDLSAGWMDDADYSVEGYLTILEINNGFQQKFYKKGYFYSVGNFTSDNQNLILASHNWSSNPDDRSSPKGRVVILDLSNNLNKDVDIKAYADGDRNYELEDGGEGQVFKAVSEFIKINNSIKNPVAISRDGNWFAMLTHSSWSNTALFLFKKVNGKWQFAKRARSVTLSSNGNAELMFSGDNSMLMLADSKLRSWNITEEKEILPNNDNFWIPDAEYINTDGSISWVDQEYQVNSQTKNGGSNSIRAIIPSRSSSGGVKVLALNISKPDFKSSTYWFDSISCCHLLEFDSLKKEWKVINEVSLPNFYFLTHAGGNEDLSEIMILNVRPSGDNLYPTGIYSEFSQPLLEEDIDHRALFVGSVAEVEDYMFGIQEGWALMEKVNTSKYNEGFAFDFHIQSTNKWWSMKQGFASRDTIVESNRSDTPIFNIDLSSEQRDPFLQKLKQTRLWVRGFTENDVISSPEISSSETIIKTENRVPNSDDLYGWSSDSFFFDVDYGSSVRYTSNNYVQQYGNGYYRLMPKSINSLNFTANLKFNNRDNREANAIIHFIENKLGQHERKSISNNLEYNSSIKGFRWDGMSTFFPYDSTKTQSLEFYSSEVNHELSFENSNNINLEIVNYNYSTIRTNDGGFVRRAQEYSSSNIYSKNDVVYVEPINRYYYYINKTASSFVIPYKTSYNKDGELIVSDQNEEYWTRAFKWNPSISLKVSQKFRLQKSNLGNGATQMYSDGINESLLRLDLTFKNRDDSEAYAILHFLEHNKGYLPFQFTPPAPYDRDRNFVCQTWTHTYEYKNNHTINAQFIEYPLFFTADQRDSNIIANKPAIKSPAKATTQSPIVIRKEDELGSFYIDKKYRARGSIKNIGGENLNIDSIRSLSSKMDGSFKIVGLKDFDFATYVNLYYDLEQFWTNYIKDQSGLTKYQWGKTHWELHGGKSEARIMPAKQFKFSQDFLNNAKSYESVSTLYSVLFNRIPGSAESQGWMDNFRINTNREVLYHMMDSEEYKMKYMIYDHPSFKDGAWLGAIPDQNSINFIYQTLLGRDVDEGGLNYWLENADVFNQNVYIYSTIHVSSEFVYRINLELAIGSAAYINSLITPPVWTESNISSQSEYIIQLPEYNEGNFVNLRSSTLDLYGKRIKIRKNSFSGGSEGGLTFDLLDDNLNSLGTYIQRNDGLITYTKDRNINISTDYYINEEFIKMHADTIIPPGKERFFEVSFDVLDEIKPDSRLSSVGDREILYRDSDGNTGNIVSSAKENFYSGTFMIRSRDGEEVTSDIILYT